MKLSALPRSHSAKENRLCLLSLTSTPFSKDYFPHKQREHPHPNTAENFCLNTNSVVSSDQKPWSWITTELQSSAPLLTIPVTFLNVKPTLSLPTLTWRTCLYPLKCTSLSSLGERDSKSSSGKRFHEFLSFITHTHTLTSPKADGTPEMKQHMDLSILLLSTLAFKRR